MFFVNLLDEKGRIYVRSALQSSISSLMGEDWFEQKIGTERFTRAFRNRTTGILSYREFYSSDLFGKIKKKIDYDGEWSIAFGMSRNT